jgi:hypothetical protein
MHSIRKRLGADYNHYPTNSHGHRSTRYEPDARQVVFKTEQSSRAQVTAVAAAKAKNDER